MKLGIVVPYFRNNHFFDKMIESILSQDCDSWMVVIVDDSGGDSPLVLSRDLRENPRFELLVNSANLGLGKAWNCGIDRLVAKWNPDLIVVAHADDELEPNFVSETISIHRRFPDAFAVHTGVRIIDGLGNVTFSFSDFVKSLLRPSFCGGVIESFGDHGLSHLLRGDFVFCPTLSFKRSLLIFPVFDPYWKMVIDLDLLSNSILSGRGIVGVRTKLYRYRRHGANLTSQLTNSTMRFIEEVALYKKIASNCEKLGFTRSSRIARRMTIIKLHISYQIAKSVLFGNFGHVRKLLVALKESFRGSR